LLLTFYSYYTISAELNGAFICIGVNQTYSFEMWKSDGTVNGTQMVQAIPLATYDINYPELFFVVFNNSWMVFSSIDNTYDQALWRTDGTAGGTFMLNNSTNIYEGVTSLDMGIIAFEDFYTGNLWTTDGTISGTQMIVTNTYGQKSTLYSIGKTIFFAFYEASSGNEPYFLSWCGDGFLSPNGQEQCDDGNTINGDGCSSICHIENGWTCPQPDHPCIPPKTTGIPTTGIPTTGIPTTGVATTGIASTSHKSTSSASTTNKGSSGTSASTNSGTSASTNSGTSASTNSGSTAGHQSTACSLQMSIYFLLFLFVSLLMI